MRSLICIHGFTGSPASFDPLARALCRRGALRLGRPTLLGHGPAPRRGAERPGTGFGRGGASAPTGAPPVASLEHFEGEVDRIARWVTSEGFAGSHLLGYSLGARVALGLLARHACLFAGATLIGVHPGLSRVEERAARIGSDERWCGLLERRGLCAFLAAWEAQPLFSGQRALDADALAAQRRVRASHRADGLARALRVLGLGQMPDYRGVLVTCPIPVRLVVGARDEKFTALARGLASIATRVVLDQVPQAGHNVLLEAPGHVESVLAGALAA